jgi:hypothetical protein
MPLVELIVSLPRDLAQTIIPPVEKILHEHTNIRKKENGKS